MTTESRIALVTGANKGIGREIVRQLAGLGMTALLAARDKGRRERAADELRAEGLRTVYPIALDVTDPDSVTSAADEIDGRFGRLDVLVNNAGITGAGRAAPGDAARSQLPGTADPAIVRAVFDTNVFGILNVLRAVLPTLRAQRSGRIVNLSSVGGFIGSAGWGIYCATKFAVEGFSEALAREVGPLGIDVIIVEPGYFRTDFLDASSLSTEGTVIDDYAETAGTTRRHANDVNHAQPGDPVKAAAAIVEIASVERPPLRIQLGRDSFAAVADKLSFVAEEQQAWRDLSVSTDHDDVAVGRA